MSDMILSAEEHGKNTDLARCLIDVDCWSEVRGQPIKPSTIKRVILDKLQRE